MKTQHFLKALTFGIGISSLSLILSITTAQPSQASFACGPHYKTYRVQSRNGAQGSGVRCLRSTPTVSLSGIWYGEGKWGNQTYRHIGATVGSMGEAADIHGNGETTDGSFPLKSLSFSSSGGPDHKVLRVTGAWNETWILETDGVVESYTSSLPPVSVCGRNFTQFQVRSTAGERGGVRCVSKSPNTLGLWYGEGQWGGTPYLHLGQLIMKGNTPQYFAYDICEPSRSKACGAFQNNLRFSTDLFAPAVSDPFVKLVINVTGAWSEEWNKVGG
jgi:hypothetical protein